MNITTRGVHSIDHYALHVPSLAQAWHFFEHFGLSVREHDGQLDIHAADGHRLSLIHI